MISGIQIAPFGGGPRTTGVAVFPFLCLTIPLLPFTNGCTPGGTDTQPVADLPVFEIEEDLRIDGYEADLVPIRWLGVGPDGTSAIFQDQLHGVRFFDSLGGDLGLVGGEGEGPGEFKNLMGQGWIGDTLWVGDFSLNRITLISTEPAFIRTLPPFTGARPAPEDEARFPTISGFFPSALYSGDRLLVSASGGEVFEGRAYFLVSRDGIVERMVLRVPQEDPERRIIVAEAGGITTYHSVPFSPRQHHTVAPDGSRLGTLTTDISGPEAGTFRVSIYDALGGEIFSRAYPFQGVPIPDQAVDSAFQPRPARTRGPGSDRPPPTLPRSVERELRSRVPPVYPPVYEILLGSDGRTWIRLYRGDGREEWLILDADGDPQGRVVIPVGIRVYVATASHVWGLESDEFDVESIVRYRVLQQK